MEITTGERRRKRFVIPGQLRLVAVAAPVSIEGKYRTVTIHCASVDMVRALIHAVIECSLPHGVPLFRANGTAGLAGERAR